MPTNYLFGQISEQTIYLENLLNPHIEIKCMLPNMYNDKSMKLRNSEMM